MTLQNFHLYIYGCDDFFLQKMPINFPIERFKIWIFPQIFTNAQGIHWLCAALKTLVAVFSLTARVRPKLLLWFSNSYMVTSGMDKKLKVFDIRVFKPLQSYFLPAGASCLSLSQRGLLSAATGDVVQVAVTLCMFLSAQWTCYRQPPPNTVHNLS